MKNNFKTPKERLDIILTARGLVKSRERAKSLIMAGKVLVNEQKVDKAGTMVEKEAHIRVLGEDIPYVSRGGLKLARALETFQIALEDKIVADIGASTGGFTDCALQNGAKKVYAIDVGYGQLAWTLRQDARVVNLERTNIRYIDEKMFAEKIDVATIDVAFISLTKVLLPVKSLLTAKGSIIALIKPQFEAGREFVGKKGVVRDACVHEQVLTEVLDYAKTIGLFVFGCTYSPIKGPEGNIEYLVYFQQEQGEVTTDFIKNVVRESHIVLS